MEIELRRLTADDVEAHNAGEDAETIRWLVGRPSTDESTASHIAVLADNLERGEGKIGYGVWVDGRLGGYVDYDPGVGDGLEPGQVNITYAVHPWARRRGVASAAVGLLLEEMAERGVGTHAAIRVDPQNTASRGVAERSGFALAREVFSSTDTRPDGTPSTLLVYLRELSARIGEQHSRG